MKGSAAQVLCVALAFAAVIAVALAQKNKKNQKQGPPRPFIPPLPIPPHPPFRLQSVTQKPSLNDPYACLPKYICIIQDKKGNKRTTIIHGLHPALRKSKPDVIDPSSLPKVPKLPGIPKPRPSITGANDDEIYRDREFSDSFLKQQDMAEAMAFVEEKRRQFLYNLGLPKQKIIPKGNKSRYPKIPLDDPNDLSKESNEDEEKSKEEKSQEDKSKEEKSQEEKSKEEKEEEKSVEVSKEEKEEEKEEPEEESPEDDSSGENKSRSKIIKYKIKNKKSSKKRSSFKSRMDDYDDTDTLHDHLVTVPWDDRLRNDTDPLKPSEIYDKLFRKVLPSLKLPSLPKLARRIPGMGFLTSDSDEVTTTTTTTTPRPGLFKRMLNRVTGQGSQQAPPNIRRRGRPIHRYRRDATENMKWVSEDMKVVKQIKDPAKQCRMIFKGCDLPYEHIMKMVSTGQVLIESDLEPTTTQKPVIVDPAFSQDDEADQAMKDKMAKKKAPKPIPQLLAQASLGGKKKFAGSSGDMPIYTKNKQKPAFEGSSEEASASVEIEPKPKKGVASLPLRPMKYHWGKPTYTVNGLPIKSDGASDFSGGITERVVYQAPTTPTTTTTTTPRPIFAAMPLDPRNNLSTPNIQHSVIKVNRTHAVHVLSKKPYNPPKTRTRDAKGQPLSFNSVFTEIAGNTGGIHDFFDRISGAFGGDGTKEAGRDFLSTFPGSNLDVHGNPEKFPAKKPAKPKKPELPPPVYFKLPPSEADKIKGKPTKQNGDELDEEDSASEEDQEDNEGDNKEENDKDEKEDEKEDEKDEEDEESENDDIADPAVKNPHHKNQRPHHPNFPGNHPGHQHFSQSQKQNQKKPEKKVPKEKEQDDQQESEEEEENDEGELDIPDNVPPFVRQAMIEDFKRKKQEQAQGSRRPSPPHQNERGRPRPGGGNQGQPFGRPGQQNQPPQRQPPRRNGGFLSSLFS